MDIHTAYLENTLAIKAPELEKYVNVRRCSNIKAQPYANEPHDERHKEFNKRGLNMQRIRTADDFKQSFQLVEHYTQRMRTQSYLSKHDRKSELVSLAELEKLNPDLPKLLKLQGSKDMKIY